MSVVSVTPSIQGVPERCEQGCGPASAEMITRGAYRQTAGGPNEPCWCTSPATLASLVNAGIGSQYVPMAFPEQSSAAIEATAAVLQSISGQRAAAVAIHRGHHWVVCDAYTASRIEEDTVDVTGISYLDPEVRAGRHSRSFHASLEQRRFVWIGPWLDQCVTSLYDTRTPCAPDNGKIHIVAERKAALILRPVRSPEETTGAPLSASEIEFRFAAAINPFHADLRTLFGLPSAAVWRVKQVILTGDRSKAARLAHIRVDVGYAARELLVVCSIFPPLHETSGLCFVFAGLLLPISRQSRRVPASIGQTRIA